MNAAEEIVKYWYQCQGYFCMESIRLKWNKEIDLLAIKVSDRQRVIDRVHVEVQVANRFAKPIKSVKEYAQEYERKFTDPDVMSTARMFLGNKYRQVEVRGKITMRGNDVRPQYSLLRRKEGVEVLCFEDVLDEVNAGFKTNIQANPVIQAIQLCKYQIRDENA